MTAELRALFEDAHRRRDCVAAALFALDCAAYVVCLVATVLVRPLGGKIALAILAGCFITRLFVLAHDACHGSLLTSRRLNQRIGRIGFLPSLTPYNLWELGHNTIHHGYTNLKGRDYVWTPLSKSEFDALPPVRRLLERIYRSAFGHGLYYLVEITHPEAGRSAARLRLLLSRRGSRRSSRATATIFYSTLGYCLLVHLHRELEMIERAGLDVFHVQDLTSSYIRTLEAWIDNIRRNRAEIERHAPGFAAVLQGYMTVAKLSFARRTALEYMILAVKGSPCTRLAAWPVGAGA